ncbi:hypothetical protein KSF73_02470 [Burkholderiaceae bacterium DAT-1]|nr:hypothetical protein [Burkholderiaceae bacterium DAT-1]
MHKWSKATLLILTISFGVFIWLPYKQEYGPSNKSASTTESKIKHSQGIFGTATQTPNTKASPYQVADAYRNLGLSNRTAFVREALKHPEIGGIYYASIASSFCEPRPKSEAEYITHLNQFSARKGASSQVQIDATNKLARMCAGAGEVYFHARKDPSLSEKDPYVNIENSISEITANEKDRLIAKEKIRALFTKNIDDPVLLISLSNNFLLSGENYKQGGAYYAASMQAICMMGGECSPRASPQILQMCALSPESDCHIPDTWDQWGYVFSGNQGDIHTTTSTANQIVACARKADIDCFYTVQKQFE